MNTNSKLPYSSLFDSAEGPATAPPFPSFPVEPVFPSLTQEEKRAQRKLARVAKKLQKQADKDQKIIDEKRSINSGKIKVIDRKTAEVFQTARNEGGHVSASDRFAPPKWQSKPLTVDLVDSLRKPRLEESLIRSVPKPETQIPKNKGKKREIPTKKLTALKKAILRERLEANSAREQSSDEEIAEAFEEITMVDDPPSASGIKHSRNFRPYCTHLITNEIRLLSEELLIKLVTFQERNHQANPIKAKAHKRYVVGFKQLTKHLLAKQLSLILIAPDIEPKQCLDEIVQEVQKHADSLRVPVVYSLKRRKLGWILHKKVPVCAIGVFSYDGCGTIVEKLLDLVEIESENYKSYLTF